MFARLKPNKMVPQLRKSASRAASRKLKKYSEMVQSEMRPDLRETLLSANINATDHNRNSEQSAYSQDQPKGGSPNLSEGLGPWNLDLDLDTDLEKLKQLAEGDEDNPVEEFQNQNE